LPRNLAIDFSKVDGNLDALDLGAAEAFYSGEGEGARGCKMANELIK
jgi:hypothetical protein